MRTLALLAAGLVVAAAADRPPSLPTRDVDVTYATSSGGRTLTQRMRWTQALRKLRVDPPTAGLFVVTDYAAHRTSVVRAQDRTVLEAPAPPPAEAATYKRRGDDVVAGQGCTEWETQDTAGRPTVACITADGVMLRARADGRTLVVATSVDFSALDASVFEIPPDYRRVSPEPSR